MADIWLKIDDDEHKELRPARSQAELIRTRNSYIAIIIAAGAAVTNMLVALKVFEIL